MNTLHLWREQLSINGVSSLHLWREQISICSKSNLHLRAANALEMQWDKISVPAHCSAQFLIILNHSSLLKSLALCRALRVQ